MQQPTLTIYKASAGSGKTFTLAVEYIKLLLLGGEMEFEHTLAVTFTNKATAEMKDRIVEQLYGIGNGLASSASYLAAVKAKLAEMGKTMTDDEIRLGCRKALTSILHNYSRFTVQTIDSFFQSVLRNLARELNLTARLQVDIDDEDVLTRAVDNVIDSLRPDSPLLPLMRTYTRERMDNAKGWDVRGELRSFAKCIFSERYMESTADGGEMLDEARLKVYLDEVESYCKAAEAPVLKAMDALRHTIDESGLEEHISSYGNLDKLLTSIAEGDANRTFSATLNDVCDGNKPLVKKASAGKPGVAEAQEEAVARLCELRDAWRLFRFCRLTADMSRKYLHPLRMVQSIDAEVNRITADANRFVLAKTPILLSQLISDNDAPFVFEKMGTKFDNVMIDEFQDTSNMQWHNFKVLLMENQASGGHDLLVGDVKQSIYRWRNGDWSILQNVDKTMGHMNVKSETLSHNFRSQSRIVEFNNAFFPRAAVVLDHIDSPDDTIIQSLYKSDEVTQKCKPGIGDHGYVRCMVEIPQPKPKSSSKADNTETESGEAGDKKDGQTPWIDIVMDDLCQQVERLHSEHDVAYEEMAIIVRRNVEGAMCVEHFARRLPHVRLVSDEAFVLRSSSAVCMIVEALRYVSRPADNPIALRYLSMHYVNEVLPADDLRMGLLSNMLPSADATPEEASAATGLPRTFFERLADLAFMPVYELAEEVYRLLSLDKIREQEAYMFAFFDELNRYLQDNPTDLHSFLNYWDEVMSNRSIPSGQVNGIRIITVHKSKGLQYHTVFMPFADWDIEKDRTESPLWLLPSAAPFNALGVMPVTMSTKLQSSAFAQEYMEEHVQCRIDSINMLYVAFTRAEKNLFVWSSEPKPFSKVTTAGDTSHGGLVSSLLDAVLPTMSKDGMMTTTTDEGGRYTIYESGAVETYLHLSDNHDRDNRMCPYSESLPIDMVSYDTHLCFRQSNESQRFIRQGDEESDELQTSFIERGKLLHEIMSRIYVATDASRIIRQYREEGIIADDQEVETIRGIIGRALRQERAQHWFDGTYSIYNECEIVRYVDGHCQSRRPDRVMMNDEEIIVVDFKFGRPNAAYEDQVRLYMDLMRQMYPDRRVSGCLWYVYRNEFDDVD